MAIKKQVGELSLHVVNSSLVFDTDGKTISSSINSYSETEEGVVLTKTSEFKIDDVDFSLPVHEAIDYFVEDNLETIVSEEKEAVFEKYKKTLK